MSADLHNPGGKVKTVLPDDLHGDALFSPDGVYRPLLWRWVGEKFPERYVVFGGMNPSTADAKHNDPTITREWAFTQREGYDGYVKVNLVDYRATSPKDVPVTGAKSDRNLPLIKHWVARASLVIICSGKLNPALAPYWDAFLQAMTWGEEPLYCFGKNADGSPKHPLYLRADTPLVPFFPRS